MARQPPLHSNWDPATLYSQDALVADGDAEDVGSEVLEGVEAIAGRLAGSARPSAASHSCKRKPQV